MGRHYWDSKSTVEHCRSVSIGFLKKHGYLNAERCTSGGISWTNRYGEETSSIGITVSTFEGDSFVRFHYTVTKRSTGDETEYDYKVQLTTTPCHFGGIRYWFACPLSVNGVYCGRRVAKLYCAPGRNYYGCRQCYDLSYESRNETRSGMFGAYGGVLRTERQIEDLRSQIKRWTWRGRPTRRVRRLNKLERQESKYLTLSRPYLSR